MNKNLQKNIAQQTPSMQMLRDSEDVRAEYNRRLDDILKKTTPLLQVDIIEQQIVNAIRTATDDNIPPLNRGHKAKPWVDEEFLALLEKRWTSTDTNEVKELTVQIRKLRL